MIFSVVWIAYAQNNLCTDLAANAIMFIIWFGASIELPLCLI